MSTQDIWSRFESAHKQTGIYTLYLQQWLSLTTNDNDDDEDEDQDQEKENEKEKDDESETRMNITDAKRILQLENAPTITENEIQQSYRTQARLHHPDKAEIKTPDKMREIIEARDLLMSSLRESKN